MGVHRIPARLLEQPVRVAVVGCGGTGSAVAAGLAYLHQTMRAFGHPAGLEVTLVDGDNVSPANCVRQPFSRGEVGANKAVVLATRMNVFWGLDWDAIPEHLGTGGRTYADLVVGCVDTRAARTIIQTVYSDWAHYWLDFGNDAESGQFVLGELCDPAEPGREEPDHTGYEELDDDTPARLPAAHELWPEIVDEGLDVDDGPSCSAREALTRQAPFTNQVLANHGLALLAQLFRYGEIRHHGGYVNLRTGTVRPIPVPDAPAEKADAGERAPEREAAAA